MRRRFPSANQVERTTLDTCDRIAVAVGPGYCQLGRIAPRLQEKVRRRAFALIGEPPE
jgi:hypothetical protein